MTRWDVDQRNAFNAIFCNDMNDMRAQLNIVDLMFMSCKCANSIHKYSQSYYSSKAPWITCHSAKRLQELTEFQDEVLPQNHGPMEFKDAKLWKLKVTTREATLLRRSRTITKNLDNSGRYTNHSSTLKLDQVSKNLQESSAYIIQKKHNSLGFSDQHHHNPSLCPVAMARPGNFFLQVGRCPWHRSDSPQQSCDTMTWSLDGPSTPRLASVARPRGTTGQHAMERFKNWQSRSVCFEKLKKHIVFGPNPFLSPFAEIASSFESLM